MRLFSRPTVAFITLHEALLTADGRLITQHEALLTADDRLITLHEALLTADGRLITLHEALLTADGRLLTQHEPLLTADGRVITAWLTPVIDARGARVLGVVETGGRRVVGASGRVDLECGVKREVLLRFTRTGESAVRCSFTGGERCELDEELFFELIPRQRVR